MGRFEDARTRYIVARECADAALQTKIDYALGNTALAMGDVPGAIAAYDACISSTARGSGLDQVRQDAEANRDFAYQQAQSPAIPQGPDDPSTSKGPDRRRSPDRQPGGEDPSAEGEPESGPSNDGTGADPESEKDGRDRTRRRRRAGGAGGSRTTPPGSVGESPEDRLDTAVESIRAAQSRRLPEEPPPSSAGNDGRDW
jgi:Ca-activated chloride channel family protein